MLDKINVLNILGCPSIFSKKCNISLGEKPSGLFLYQLGARKIAKKNQIDLDLIQDAPT